MSHIKTKEAKIDKGVPIPPPTVRFVYPFKDMQVGDSFEVETTHDNTVRVAADYYKRKTKGWGYTMRCIEGIKYRLWRIS